MNKFLLLACVLAVTGCAAASAPPRENHYRLTFERPARPAAQPVLPGVLEVSGLHAEGLTADRALAYSYADQPRNLLQYSYESWASPPEEMLQDRLSVFLRNANLARQVVTPSLRARPDYFLQGTIKRFEQVVAPVGSLALVEIELGLTRARDDALLVHKTYRVEKPADNDSAEAAVRAMDAAVAELFQTFTQDVAGLAR